MTHQIVNVVTAFLMGAILMALGFVLLTRSGGCMGSTRPAATAPVGAPASIIAVAAPSPPTAAVDPQELSRAVQEAVRRQREAEDRRWRNAICANPITPYDVRQDLGCDGRWR